MTFFSKCTNRQTLANAAAAAGCLCLTIAGGLLHPALGLAVAGGLCLLLSIGFVRLADEEETRDR